MNNLGTMAERNQALDARLGGEARSVARSLETVGPLTP